MRILIAEDDEIILATLESRLKREGHEVFIANNGSEAINQFTTLLPDLVITDIMMPFNSGLEILGCIRESKANTKVMLLSSMGQEDVVLEAFKLGADDYITKPFSPNELAARVERFALATVG